MRQVLSYYDQAIRDIAHDTGDPELEEAVRHALVTATASSTGHAAALQLLCDYDAALGERLHYRVRVIRDEQFARDDADMKIRVRWRRKA